jgi:hypothetical protein
MTVFLSELTTEYLWPGCKNCSILYTSENNQDHGTTGSQLRREVLSGVLQQSVRHRRALEPLFEIELIEPRILSQCSNPSRPCWQGAALLLELNRMLKEKNTPVRGNEKASEPSDRNP